MSENPKDAKVALITGASRRIGAEIANTLHYHGMHVVLHYNQSYQEAQALCSKLNQIRPNSAKILQADLTQFDHLHRLVTEAHGVWGRLDALINNASSFYKTPFPSASEKDWDALFAANLKAPFFLSQAAYSYLVKSQGAIINITDIHAETPLSNYTVYCLTKAGLLMLTRQLAKELAPAVRVNAVAPGSIIWPEGENSLSDAEKQMIIKQVPLARGGSPKDIAQAVWFLLHDAPYISGQVLNVDGGRTLK